MAANKGKATVKRTLGDLGVSAVQILIWMCVYLRLSDFDFTIHD
jgi:hypothetical protein